MSIKTLSRSGTKNNTVKNLQGTISSFNIDLSTSFLSGSKWIPRSDPIAISLNTDSTKIFTVTNNGILDQYSLPFPNAPLYSAVYEKSNTLPLGSLNLVRGLCFSSDGYNIHLIGRNGGSNQGELKHYQTPVAFDVGNVFLRSTVVLETPFALISQDYPSSIGFSKDGLKMFISDPSVIQNFQLKTPWQSNTAYNKVTFFPNRTRISSDIKFLNNGNTMILLHGDVDELREYALPSPYEHYNANSVGNLYLQKEIVSTTPAAFDFSQDGTILYVACATSDSILQYNLNTPFDIKTANISINKKFLREYNTLSGSEPRGIFVGNTGSTLFFISTSSTTSRLYQVNLTEKWNTNTAVSTNTFINLNIDDIGEGGGVLSSLFFGNSGSSAYFAGFNNDSIYQLNLKSPWNATLGANIANSKISYFQYSGVLEKWSWQSIAKPLAVKFNPAGNVLWHMARDDLNVRKIGQFSLSTPWNLSTLQNYNRQTLMNVDPLCFRFGNVGYNAYVTFDGGADANVHQYALLAPYDVGTMRYMKHFRTSTGEATAGGHALSQDGSNLYVVGTTKDTINQYTLSTPWDIGTTGNVVVSSANIFVTDGAPIDMRFNPEGNVMIVLGENTDFLHTFNLGIPWMVSTAIKANTHSANAFGEALPKDFFINPEGNVLILYGQTKKRPVRIPLNESWNLASASNADVTFGSAKFETFEGTPTTIDFNPSGKIAYIGGTMNDRIFPVFLANSYYNTSTADFGFPLNNMTFGNEGGDFVWSNTGSSLFVMDNACVIKQFSAKVPYDLYSIDIGFDINNPQLKINNLETTSYSLAISDDNQYLYVLGANDNLYRIQFKDPHNPNLSNVTLPIKNLAKDLTTGLIPSSIKVLPNGNIIVGINTVSGSGFPSAGFYDYPAPINANVSDISYTYSNVYTSTSANDTLPTAITFVNNGNVAFITGETSNDITQHLLSQAYNIATARRSTDAANTYTEITFADIGGLETSQDGRYIFATEKSSTNGRVWRVEMLTPNVIANTSIYNRAGGTVFNISPWNGTGTTTEDNFDFNEDGTKLFYLPSNPYNKNFETGVLASSEITQFDLTTPYDVALMSNSGISANTSYFNVYNAVDMKFSKNGRCLYITQSEDQTNYYVTQAYLIDKNAL